MHPAVRRGEPQALLRVENLVAEFATPEGPLRAVEGVSFELYAGRTLALVGESGCGKSVTANCILRLLPANGRIAHGHVWFQETDLATLSIREMRPIRGGRIAMIFQEPMTALNPVLTVGAQVAEAVELHAGLRGRAARRRVVDLLAQVGIRDAAQRANDYPHEFSGGMRQRVMIAMALAGEPSLLIADEPTTALDVTIQAQILDLLQSLQRDRGLAILFITHDLGIVSHFAHDVAVMYAGRIVETAPVDRLLHAPSHPYTRGLLACVPRWTREAPSAATPVAGDPPLRSRLPVIPGELPDPRRRPGGCAFQPRCEPGRDDRQCREERPDLQDIGTGHACACWKAAPEPARAGPRS